jgi:cell division GTPase FtsZ
MKLALVGVGTAGGRLVDRLLQREAATDRRFCGGNVLVFDTDQEPLDEYDRVPEDRRILIGDTYPEAEGEGTGGDLDLGVSVARADGDEIRREFDVMDVNAVDAILLAAGFGGGTGGGAGAVVLEQLQELYEVPVYVLGVLPHAGEGDDRIHNAARSLRSFVPMADNTVLFDNDTWYRGGDGASSESPDRESNGGRGGASGEDGGRAAGEAESGTPDGRRSATPEVEYGELNREFARRVVAVFGAGELEHSPVAETRLDSSDVIRTLATGGVSTIGHATTEVETASGGLLAWLRSLFRDTEPEAPTDAANVLALVRRAVTARLTLPCEVSSADRALVGLSGPPEACSRKGFESARHWLAEETDTAEVLAGDEPDGRATELTAVVLLSTVTDVPRIDEIQRRATAADDR